MILSGWAVYAMIYLSFGLSGSPSLRIALFIAYGIYFGLTEPTEQKAWIAGLVPTHLRGTAFGYYHGVIGLGALPASLLFGLIWQVWGTAAAFTAGACPAMAACLLPSPEYRKQALSSTHLGFAYPRGASAMEIPDLAWCSGKVSRPGTNAQTGDNGSLRGLHRETPASR